MMHLQAENQIINVLQLGFLYLNLRNRKMKDGVTELLILNSNSLLALLLQRPNASLGSWLLQRLKNLLSAYLLLLKPYKKSQ